jgi:hypothetical protein
MTEIVFQVADYPTIRHAVIDLHQHIIKILTPNDVKTCARHLGLLQKKTLTAKTTSQVSNHYAALCETVPLYPIQNEQDYEVAVNALNHLLDLGGAYENHPLARLVTALGIFIENYEQHLPSC